MVERAAAAAVAGLDSLFVGDHHATGPVPYYQNSAVLGRLLAEWGDRLAGALYLLLAWNPVLVAEQVGTLAALAGGRFVLQCAVGAGAQLAAMGAAPATSPGGSAGTPPSVTTTPSRATWPTARRTCSPPWPAWPRCGASWRRCCPRGCAGGRPAAAVRAAAAGPGWPAGDRRVRPA